MSTIIRRRCPAPRPGVRTPRLALEALEPRCACAAGRVNPTGALLPARPAEGTVSVVAHRVETMIVTVGAKGLTFTPRAGAPFTGAVAQVDLAPASQDAAAGFFANIWWGNGFSTAGVIQLAGHGGYDVIGSMTYSDPGDYQVMIELAGPDGARVTAVSLAHVEPAATPDVDVVPPASEGDPKGQDTPDPPAGTPEEPSPTAGGGRTPGDTSGAVPWLRLPDPRPDPAAPASQQVARNDPPPAAGPAVPPPAAVGPPPGGGGDAPVDDTGGPAYLTAAGEPPAEYSGVPAVDAAPTGLRPIPVAGDGGALVVLAGPAADVDPESAADGPPPAAVVAAAAGTVAVPPPDDAGRRQRGGLWWKSLTWCVALIFTERMVAARAADRRPPRLPVT